MMNNMLFIYYSLNRSGKLVRFLQDLNLIDLSTLFFLNMLIFNNMKLLLMRINFNKIKIHIYIYKYKINFYL